MMILLSFSGFDIEADFLSTYVLKDPTSRDYIKQVIKDAKLKSSEPGLKPLLGRKQLAEATSQFILDVNLMSCVYIDNVADALNSCKEMNKPLFKEFQKAMSCIESKIKV